ncbi:mandelate racemase/muconate lactonizing enzyme family protein [Planctomonas sp. JC2975]|uniref:mandelate racemase/muconate lactonizing enzyme family protein n=1 Tax=Planctomonas sp. JC2975 TaxID=2729626 RepID=UPI0014728C5E|nr:mandelate racemase/muconate lactonizing enzyme family protein [Planctomonas sp. JC2975]NNC12790.1 mandelate racemase/muconate lactonizing enzyme family protein [Planctomonas sp. JC2975]
MSSEAGVLGVITGLRTRAIDVPLIRPWGTDVTEHHLIEVLVDTESGVTGHGFSWTPTIGAHSVLAMLDHDIRDFAVGRDADPATLWTPLWERLHEAGSGGVTTIAMAGLDLALWDAVGRAAQKPVADLIGERRASLRVYGSGVNRHYSLDQLVEQARRWADAGYSLVKLKVGGHPLAEDVDRVAAVRETIGPDVDLAIDANQLWTLDEAERAVGELSRFRLHWIEEPLRADDLLGHAALRSRIEVPVALGENLHTVYRFREAIELGAADIVQPNVIRVGGITPFLAIAELAEAAGIPVYPHLLPDLSGQLSLTLATETPIEDVEDASFERLGLLAEPGPIVIDGTVATPTGRPGLGIVLS